ncbi:DUF748 domain-containing protein [Marinomonas sp. M1K-6]|uniref:DUF748 domain-containing protein n=1 Tax=Marinomonas profundi TaxID=2726122 RepID=A0A847R7D2_9GAMM|nr:DUF748 domain-containing protein [Marinomonas profundi]NLQ18393.1 DUF748 domain-containing protein [Marinomonas profundi]UDV02450.1 DUF748 domain-containing protein [Marinomonas profundi]
MMTRRHFRLFIFYPFAVITALITSIWIATPFIAKHYLSDYFQQQGKEMTLGKLSVDFFPPKIDLNDMVINDQNQDTLTLKRAIFAIELWPLVEKTLRISEAKIDALTLQVAQQENTWVIAGINTEQYATEETTQETAEPPKAADHSPWTIQLPSFAITNSQVNLSRQVDLNIPAKSDTLALTHLFIKDVSGQGMAWKGEVSLSALVNQATLSFNSQFNYSPEQTTANVDAINARLPIESFRHFLPSPYNEGKGQLDLTSRFQFSQTQVDGVPVYEVNNLTLDTQIRELDLRLNEQDKVATQSTSLALSQSTLQFVSADKLMATGSLDLQSTQFSFTQAEREVVFDSLTLKTPFELKQDELGLATTGKLDAQLKKVFFAQAEQTVQFAHLTLNAPFDLKQDKQQGLTAKVAATELDMDELVLSLDSLALQNKQLHVALNNVAFNMDTKEALTASLLVDIQSHGLSVQQAGNSANYDEFSVSNNINFQQQGDNISAQNSQLDIKIAGLKATQDDGKQFSLGGATFTAEQIDFDQVDQQPPAIKGVNLNVKSQSLDSLLTHNKRIAAWKNGNINNLSFSQQGELFDLALAQLELTELSVSQAITDKNEQSLPPLGHIGNLKIEQVKANQDGADIKQITTNSMNISLILDSQKRIENLVFIDQEAQKTPEPIPQSANIPREKDAQNAINNTQDAEQKPAFKAPYYVILDAYDTTGSSSIYVQDKSISPALQRSLDIETLSLRNLNTHDKDQATVFALKARNGKYTTIQSDVSIYPLADKLTMISELIIKEAELPPYSSYIANVLGYQIDSGQLNLDLKLKAKNGILDGKSNILLREFDLGGQKESSSVVRAGAVPLNIAVGILKDSDNNIDLDIPLSGDIENPEFGWQDFLLLPVRKALYSASSSYLMQTFVPYANVITIAQFAGEQLLRIRVEPLIFTAEDSELNESQEIFLKQLTALMKDKKDSQLKACGIASYLDLGLEKPPISIDDNTRAAAISLAQQRAEHLKDYLVKDGIASSRIFLCSPEIDLSSRSKPRIELNF